MRILYNTQGKSDGTITIENSNTLTDGSYIFSYTQSQDLNIIDLNSLDNAIDLSSLENGEGMFQNSNLSDSTLENIATTIKKYTDGSTHVIDLGNNVDMNGSAFTLLAFGIEAPLNVPYIIKVEGNST